MAVRIVLLMVCCVTLQISAANGFQYLGCFVDSRNRDLPKLAESSNRMTVGRCSQLCRSYSYFGVQNSNECWCGNSYGKHGRRADSECNRACTGNPRERCGAGWRNSVYSTFAISTNHGFQHLGCFVDSPNRDLPKLAESSNRMSVGRCGQLCKAYSYFGVQNSNECWCGNSYGKHGKKPINECNRACTGNPRERCGAGWRNNVYSTGLTSAASAFQYLGCFVDSRNRDLPKLAESSNRMSVSRCAQLCNSYHFFGVQNANECWCGNSYGKHGKKPNSECNRACTGNSQEKCGAGWRNNVYSTGSVLSTVNLEYLGCFVDSRNRDLPKLAESSNRMSVSRCAQLCNSYHFFGVQNANECWCGNSYGKHGKKPNSECNRACTGNSKEKCGAGWRNSVYSNGSAASSETIQTITQEVPHHETVYETQVVNA